MDFVVLAGGITALVIAALMLALLRRQGGVSGEGTQIQIYRDQLEEIDRDLVREVISAQEAAGSRIEISRRLLEADRQATGDPDLKTSRPSPVLALLLAGVVSGGTALVYLQIGAPGYPDMPIETRFSDAEAQRLSRPTQAETEHQIPARDTVELDPEHMALIEQLRVVVKNNPDDLQGNVLLAQKEMQLGNFGAAHKAQANVIRIKGDQVTVADLLDYVDMLVLAVDGYVSPEAEKVARQVLVLDERNGIARYYLGLMQAQNGRPDLAFSLWRDLLEESRPQAPWVPPIRRLIGIVAQGAGVQYSLPELEEPDSAAPGPSAADVAASRDLSVPERDEMIAGMVAQLSDRLDQDGGSVEEWARLIGSLSVLGETETAREKLAEARAIFTDSPQALTLLDATASHAGLDE